MFDGTTNSAIFIADVKERVVKVSIEAQPIGMFAVYRISDYILCESDECDSAARSQVSDAGALDEMTAFEFDQMLEYLAIDTVLFVVTDYSRVWFSCFCDKCGQLWSPSEEDSVDISAIADELTRLSGREFAMNWGRRHLYAEWDEAATLVKEYFGAELRYEDGNFLLPDEKRQFHRSVAAIRLNVQNGVSE